MEEAVKQKARPFRQNDGRTRAADGCKRRQRLTGDAAVAAAASEGRSTRSKPAEAALCWRSTAVVTMALRAPHVSEMIQQAGYMPVLIGLHF